MQRHSTIPLLANGGAGGPNPFGLDHPIAVMVFKKSLFVVEEDNQRVVVWTPIPRPDEADPEAVNGTEATVVIGRPTLSSATTSTPENLDETRFIGPNGVCAAGTSLYVVDTHGHRVLEFVLKAL